MNVFYSMFSLCLYKAFDWCEDSALNHLVNGPGYEEDSREPSPTKSITPLPDEVAESVRMADAAKSRPGSPSDRNG